MSAWDAVQRRKPILQALLTALRKIDKLYDDPLTPLKDCLLEMKQYARAVDTFFSEYTKVTRPSKGENINEFFNYSNVSSYDTFKSEERIVNWEGRYNIFDLDNFPSLYIIKYLPFFDEWKNAMKEGLLDNEEFIQSLHTILYNCIQYYGWGHLSTIGYIEDLIFWINIITRPCYIINGCYNQKSYTCGRAVSANTEPGKNTRFVIHGTVSIDDDSMDGMDFVNRILPTLSSKYSKNNDKLYYTKYLKYKNKYLDLKKQITNKE